HAEQPAADHLRVDVPLTDPWIIKTEIISCIATDERERLARVHLPRRLPASHRRPQLPLRWRLTGPQKLLDVALAHSCCSGIVASAQWLEKTLSSLAADY